MFSLMCACNPKSQKLTQNLVLYTWMVLKCDFFFFNFVVIIPEIVANVSNLFIIVSLFGEMPKQVFFV